MKNVLSFLLTISFLSSNVIILVACSNTKLNQSEDEEGLTEEDNLKEEISEEIAKQIITPAEDSNDGLGFIVKSFKDIGYNTFAEVSKDIQDQAIIINKNFEEKIKDYIIIPKLSEISREIKEKYDVFREQQDIIQLDKDLIIKKEAIQFKEIFKLLKEENNINNNGLGTTLAEDLELIYKFSLSFSTKYTINNDEVRRHHNLVFYIANDVTEFSSIQDLLTDYVKNNIVKFFRNLLYQNFPNNKISEDINQLISTFINKNSLLTYIQDIFKVLNSENLNSPLNITSSAIISSNTKNAMSKLEKISSYNADLNEIFDILASDDPGQLNDYLKDAYQFYLDSEVFKEKRDSYEALTFSLDLISLDIYGYSLKSIFLKDIKVNVNFDKLINKVKSDIDKISAIIRLLFMNNNSKLEKINPKKDIGLSYDISSTEKWYRWTLLMDDNKPIWDASDCFIGEKHCITWDKNGTGKPRSNYMEKYLIELINKDVLNKWFIKNKIQNDNELKKMFESFNTKILVTDYCCRRFIEDNHDFKQKPKEYGTNVRNRMHLYQIAKTDDPDTVYYTTAYIWDFSLDNILIKTTFSKNYYTNFIIRQK